MPEAGGLAAILGAVEPVEKGFAASIPPGWHQGRTAYGGFSAALVLEAARRLGGDMPPLRSAQIAFVGPLAGTVTVSARVLRRGRNATWIAAEIAGDDGGIGLVASLVFMAPIASEVHLDRRSPPERLVAPDEAAEVPDRGRPAFLDHFEVRFAVPRSGERRPEIVWWVRHRQRDGLDPFGEVLSVADALPPGVLPLVRQPLNVSSMTWQINLLTSRPATSDGWWLLRSASDFAEAGCSSQDMQVWNAAGEPIAAGTQAVALFG